MAPVLSIPSVGSQTITVSWVNDPSMVCYRSTLLVTDTIQNTDISGSQIRKYDVSLNNINPSNPTAFAIPGLVNGRTYLVTYIQSLTSTNSSQSQSNTVSAIPYTIPATPEIKITQSFDGSGVLYPMVEFNGDGGNPYNFIEFIYSTTTQMYSQVFDISGQTIPDGTDISFTILGVSNFTTYEVACYLWNDAGPSAISNTWVVTPSDRPNPPRNVTAISKAISQQAEIGWNAPNDVSIANIDYYTVDVSGNGSIFQGSGNYYYPNVSPSSGALDISFVATGLTNGLEYQFRVYAHNSYGFSIASNTTPRLQIYGPPGIVTSLTLTGGFNNGGVPSESLKVSFQLPTDNGGYPLSQYFIDISGTSAGSSSFLNRSTFSYTTGDTSFNYTFSGIGLVNGETYKAIVSVSNTGTYNAPVKSTPVTSSNAKPYTVPTAPTDLSLNAADRSMLILWEPPSSNGGDAIDGYYIDISGVDPSSNWVTFPRITLGVTTSYLVTGLTNGFTYNFKVTAFNDAGAGANVNGNGIPHADPGIPQNLVETVTSQTSAELSWLPPAVDPAWTILGYGIFRYDPVTETIPAPYAVTAGLSYELTTLTTGTQYKFGVCTIARDVSDNTIQQSAIVTVGPFTTSTIPQIVSIDVSGTVGAGNQQIILTINDRDSLIKNWVVEVFKLGSQINDLSANICSGTVASGYYVQGTPCVIYIPFNYYTLGSTSTQPIFAAAANDNGLGYQQYNWSYILN
jgi:titin